MATKTRPPLEKITTPKGTASFPHLTSPDTKFDAAGEYKVGLILSEEAAAPLIEKLEQTAEKAFQEAKAKINQDIKEAKGEKLGKAKKALASLQKADLPVKPVYDDDGNETGSVILSFKMKASYTDKEKKVQTRKPAIFDAKGTAFKPTSAIWGGSEMKVSGFLSPYYIPATGQAGVSLRLAGVQIISLSTGSGGGSASSYGFEEEEGFSAEELEEPEGTGESSSGEEADNSADEF